MMQRLLAVRRSTERTLESWIENLNEISSVRKKDQRKQLKRNVKPVLKNSKLLFKKKRSEQTKKLQSLSILSKKNRQKCQSFWMRIVNSEEHRVTFMKEVGELSLCLSKTHYLWPFNQKSMSLTELDKILTSTRMVWSKERASNKRIRSPDLRNQSRNVNRNSFKFSKT
jgi:hypothetical protein